VCLGPSPGILRSVRAVGTSCSPHSACDIQEQNRQDGAGRRELCHSSSPGCPFSRGIVYLSLRKMDHTDSLPLHSDMWNSSTYFYIPNPLIRDAPVKTNLLGGSRQQHGAAQGLRWCGGTRLSRTDLGASEWQKGDGTMRSNYWGAPQKLITKSVCA